MYSVVLAMALAGGAEAPNCHMFGSGGCFGSWNRGGCYGCGGGFLGFGHGCRGQACYGGCHGGYVQPTYGCQGGVYYQGQPAPTPEPKKEPEKIPEPKKQVVPTPATMQVTVPPNTKLSVAGYVSKQTTTERTLITPPIQPGEEFTYTLVAESFLQGQRVSQSQEVTLRPGQNLPVVFNFTAADVVAN